MSGQSVTQTLLRTLPQADGSEIRIFLTQVAGKHFMVEMQRYASREDGAMVPAGMPCGWVDEDLEKVYQQVLAAFQKAEQSKR